MGRPGALRAERLRGNRAGPHTGPMAGTLRTPDPAFDRTTDAAGAWAHPLEGWSDRPPSPPPPLGPPLLGPPPLGPPPLGTVLPLLPPQTLRRPSRRRVAQGVALGSALALLIGGTVAALVVRPSRPAPPAVAEAGEATAAPGTAGAEPAADPRFGGFYGQRLHWQACDAAAEHLECADLDVPVDWANPRGATVSLHVVRHPATGRRQGSLLLNPGGPGGSGARFASRASHFFSPALVAAFDLVGWDPRGVNQVLCLDAKAKGDALLGLDASPDTAAELTALDRAVQKVGKACLEGTGELLRHVDSVSTARDLDVLRAAVGDTRLTYYGASAGTLIGAWYAQLFPQRVGRLVLDSAVDPTLDGAGLEAGQARGIARAFGAYLAGCRSRRTCPLRTLTPAAAAVRVKELIARTDQHPLTLPGQRLLPQSYLVQGIVNQLYSPSLWPALDGVLAPALHGDGSGVLRLPTVPDGALDPMAHLAIQCLDVPDARTDRQVLADHARLTRAYPTLGHEINGGSPCRLWPVRPTVRPQRLTATGAAPVLVVGTTRDPATPYEWSQSLARQLSSGRLLTYVGDGHAAYRQHDPCIVDAVDAYLLGQAVPAAGTRCPA